MFLGPFARFALKVVMALVGGSAIVEEKSGNDRREVGGMGGVEVGGGGYEGHGNAPNHGGHALNVEGELPTGSPSVEIVRKRGRGRPRIKGIGGAAVTVVKVVKEVSEGEGNKKKRGRGRPRIKPILSEGETSVKKVAAPKAPRIKPIKSEGETSVKKVAATQAPVTPMSSDRPIREKRSVQRFIYDSSSEKTREFIIGKGNGTALKDIPNVAYKVSKRSKADHILKVLHAVLFVKRGKVLNIRNNILQFSGFVQGENKNTVRNSEKGKEKLEKLHKENLVKLCDVLDLQYSKTATKKEELVSKVFEFLEAPYITQNILVEEQEQNSKQRKRKRAGSETPGKAPGEITEKRRKSFGRSSDEESKHEESDFDKETEKEHPEKRKVKQNQDNEEHEAKRKSSNRSAKGSKRKVDGENVEKREDEKQDEQIVLITPSNSSKSADNKRKRNNVDKGEDEKQVKRTRVRKSQKNPSKSKTKNPEDNILDAKDFVKNDRHILEKSEVTHVEKENNNQKDELTEGENESEVKRTPSDPTDEEICSVIRELLNEVDFNTATLSDIVKQLGNHFNKDFTDQKAHLRVLVQEELTKIAEDDDDDNEDIQYM